jgi:hypothetical protein
MQTDTSYLGLRLPHPFVAGASPFGYRVDTVKRLEDAGCAVGLLHSCSKNRWGWSTKVELPHNPADARFSETIGYFPTTGENPVPTAVEHVHQVTQAVKIP